ncbi:protein of unknown function [Methylocella tundrae]|uniref:Uncharacterized protein n=1 Tax=Methylocella tundrae TaxID=227605 RepID=A0A4U8YVL9_METTU|nr:protein of unknown function [Methylocella tundrae]
MDGKRCRRNFPEEAQALSGNDAPQVEQGNERVGAARAASVSKPRIRWPIRARRAMLPGRWFFFALLW